MSISIKQIVWKVFENMITRECLDHNKKGRETDEMA
jgi:hypothetical protein